MNKIALLFTTLLVTFGLITFSASPSVADILRYTDDSGHEHFVGSLDKVPEQYRSQLDNAKPLPEISKVTGSPQTSREANREAPTLSASSGTSHKKVEIFVTSWCPYCKKLEKYLSDNRVKYTKYDIETNSTGKKIHAQLGGGGVPVIRIGTQVLHGYDPAALSTAIKN